MEFVCSKGHIFRTLPYNMLKEKDCPKCTKLRLKLPRYYRRKSNKEFLNDLHKRFGYKITPLEKYRSNRELMWFKCDKEHIFHEYPNVVLHFKTGCPICGKTFNIKNKTLSNSQFLYRLKSTYGNEYTPLEEYKGRYTKIKFYHTKCKNTFSQTPDGIFTDKEGCTHCQCNYIGEDAVRDFLFRHHIKFEYAKKFKNCYDKNKHYPLHYDFYLPKMSTCIEYNGWQHYRPTNFTGNIPKNILLKIFHRQKYHDYLKKLYCYMNHMKLITIHCPKFGQKKYVYPKVNSVLTHKLIK